MNCNNCECKECVYTEECRECGNCNIEHPHSNNCPDFKEKECDL